MATAEIGQPREKRDTSPNASEGMPTVSPLFPLSSLACAFGPVFVSFARSTWERTGWTLRVRSRVDAPRPVAQGKPAQPFTAGRDAQRRGLRVPTRNAGTRRSHPPTRRHLSYAVS